MIVIKMFYIWTINPQNALHFDPLEGVSFGFFLLNTTVKGLSVQLTEVIHSKIMSY